MLSNEDILQFFGTAAGLWALGFAWGKTVAWLREFRNAA